MFPLRASPPRTGTLDQMHEAVGNPAHVVSMHSAFKGSTGAPYPHMYLVLGIAQPLNFEVVVLQGLTGAMTHVTDA